MIEKDKIYGVLKGCIAEQHKFDTSEMHRLSENLLQFSENCLSNHMFKAYEIINNSTIRIITERPEDTLTIAVMYRIWMRKQTPNDNSHIYDMKFSIVIGPANANYKDIRMMSGTAFTFSEWSFSNMKYGEKMQFDSCFSDSTNKYLDLFTKCMSGLVSTLSRTQAHKCYDMLAVENLNSKNISEIVNAKNNRIAYYANTMHLKLIQKTLRIYADKILSNINN